MTTSDWLKYTQAELKAAGIDTARLDCLVLLEDGTNKDRSWLLSHPEYELQGSILKKLNIKIAQRAKHTPLAYIRGHAEFYGREFVVNEHTLVPRPETESIIDLLKSLTPAVGTHVLDIGTGTGCIAVTAALELPNIHVSACDINDTCLHIARRNAKKLGASVSFFTSNLLAPAPPQDILLANLPYVPDDFAINTAATHEPALALFGGPDGLNLYRRLFEQISQNNWQPSYIITESLPEQHSTLIKLAATAGFTLQTSDDLAQLFIHK